MEQMNIFDESLYQPKNRLTPRQWKLHNVLKNAGARKMERKEILEIMDEDYHYSQETAEYPKRQFMNLSCVREYTEDLDAIIRDETIQHVYVGGSYAASEKEARLYLLREKISALKTLKKVSIQGKKLNLDGQQRLTFASELDHWESILSEAEKQLSYWGE